MTKKKLDTSIKFLTELFKSNDSALKAIETLKAESEKVKFEEPVKSAGKFPKPENIKAGGFVVYSDGACRGNPGPGAWGMVAQSSDGEVIFYDSGFEEKSTNNRMELQGAIEGLSSLLEFLENKNLPSSVEVRLVSDSKYVLDGIEKWVPGWKARGWKKADKKVPENVERWKQLDEITSEFSNISYEWVKGHRGHPQNEYCDQLANIVLDKKGY